MMAPSSITCPLLAAFSSKALLPACRVFRVDKRVASSADGATSGVRKLTMVAVSRPKAVGNQPIRLPLSALAEMCSLTQTGKLLRGIVEVHGGSSEHYQP